MTRQLSRFFRIVSAAVILVVMWTAAWGAGISIVPSSTVVKPGDDFYFDVVVTGIPAPGPGVTVSGLGGVQFRLSATPSTGTVNGVSDLSQAGANDVAIVTPLLISPATPGRSGFGDFFWNGKGANGILVMDNETLVKGSALYTFAHTNGSHPLSGSGVVARFAARVGSGITSERLDIGLSDVLLMNGGSAYTLDSVTGASIQLRCMAKVPALTGLSLSVVQSALEAANLTLGSVYEIDNQNGLRPYQVVLDQSTPAGNDLDCRAPVNLAINTPPADPTNFTVTDKLNDESGSVMLAWTASVSGDTAGYRVYSGTSLLKQLTGMSVNGTEIAGLPNGSVTRLKVSAYDAFGNESAGVFADATPLDDVKPVITLSGVMEGGYYSGDVAPQVTVTDGGSVTWNATLNDVQFSNATISADGAYVLAVTAVDQAGNHAVKSVFFTVDRIAPTLSVSLPLDDSLTIGTALTIAGTTTDTGGIQQLTVNGIAIPMAADGSFSYDASLSVGPNVIVIVASDKAGNQTTLTRTIIRDTGELVTVNPVTIPYRSPAVTLTGTMMAAANLYISTTSAASIGAITYPEAGTWSCTVTGLTSGANTVIITAIDPIGYSRSLEQTITYVPSLSISLSTDAVAADYQGNLEITAASGLLAGDEVLIEQFVDANANSVVDAGDYVVRSFKVTDGSATVNLNVQGDEDSSLNPSIRTTLNYYLVNDLYHAPGRYLFRASAGTESANAPFAVTPVSTMQTISGMVTDGAAPVPGTLVSLYDTWNRPVAWTLADESGAYLLNVRQPGTYRLLPLKYGHVATAVPVLLAAGQGIANQTLMISAGTHRITGQVKDLASNSGIAGVWVRAAGTATSGVAITNDTGAYDLLLPADRYTIDALSDTTVPGAYAKGYVDFNSQSLNITVNNDTAGVDVYLTAGDIPLRGQVIDSAGNAVPGLPIEARIRGLLDSREPVAYGVGNSSGNYYLNLVAGTNWDVSLDNTAAQILGYIGSIRRDLATSNGQLNDINLTVYPITAWVQGAVKNSVNQPMAGVSVILRNADSSIYVSTVSATDGTYRLGAFAGNWYVDALTEDKGALPVPEQNINLIGAQTVTLNFATDITPPTVMISSPSVGTTGNNTPQLLYTVSDGNVIVKVDGTVVSKVSGNNLDLLANGKHTVRVEATDPSGNLGFAEIVFTVNYKPLTITTASLANGTVGVGYSKAIAVTGGVKPYRWSLTAGSLPSGLSLNSVTGAINGTISATSLPDSFNITVQVQDSQGSITSSSFGLNVIVAPLTISTTSLANGTVGVGYSKAIAVTGGVKPYAWSLASGNLPSGLTLNSVTGAINGTISATSLPGTFNFTAQVQDGQGSTTSIPLTMNVVAAPLTISTASLANGTVGVGYSKAIAVTGGVKPYTWSLASGSLPSGLTLKGSTGSISGTISATSMPGSFNITVQVLDGQGIITSAPYSINVVAAPLTISTTSLSNGTVGVGYSKAVAVTGGVKPYAWSLASGNLPSGLSLNGSTGAISGTISASSLPNSFNITVQVLDGQGISTSVPLTLNVVAAPLTITTNSLTNGTVGVGYSKAVAVTGGVKPYAWSLTSGDLPSGLTLNGSTGAISGTISATSMPGSFSITVQVLDGQGLSTSTPFSFDVVAAPLTITTNILANGTVGVGYSKAVAVTGGVKPYAWSLASGSLPSGLSLNGTTGAISGTISATSMPGSFSITVQVLDGQGLSTSTPFSFDVVAAPLTITTNILANGTVGVSYSKAVAVTGGVKPYSWTLASGSLPSGLSLNGTTGAISGTISATMLPGTFSFTVQVVDGQGLSTSVPLTLNVVAAPLTITTNILANGTVGVGYSKAVAVTGGVKPYSWTLASGSLPSGLSLNGTTGAISGTISATMLPGTFSFTVQVLDGQGLSTSVPLTLNVVAAPLTITTNILANGTVGVGYSKAVAVTGGVKPYSWTLASGSLPSGLSLNGTTGAISGTISATMLPGTFSFTVQVLDGQGLSTSVPLTLNVVAAPLTITTNILANGTVGVGYSKAVAVTGGVKPYSWTLASGSLPSGLSLNGTTGAISGTISATMLSGTFSFTVQVLDGQGSITNSSYVLSVVAK